MSLERRNPKIQKAQETGLTDLSEPGRLIIKHLPLMRTHVTSMENLWFVRHEDFDTPMGDLGRGFRLTATHQSRWTESDVRHALAEQNPGEPQEKHIGQMPQQGRSSFMIQVNAGHYDIQGLLQHLDEQGQQIDAKEAAAINSHDEEFDNRIRDIEGPNYDKRRIDSETLHRDIKIGGRIYRATICGGFEGGEKKSAVNQIRIYLSNKIPLEKTVGNELDPTMEHIKEAIAEISVNNAKTRLGKRQNQSNPAVFVTIHSNPESSTHEDVKKIVRLILSTKFFRRATPRGPNKPSLPEKKEN